MSFAAARLLLDTLRLDRTEAAEQLRSRWEGADLGRVLALARFEGVALWLQRRLHEAGVTLADPLGGALRRAAHEDSLANLRIDAVTADVATEIEAAGLEVVLIKGQARRALAGRLPYADARRLSDVDLLLPEQHADAAWALLRSRGFEPTFGPDAPFRTVHHRPVLHDARGVTVELHVSTSPALPAAVAWQRSTEGGLRLEWNGRTVRVPALPELAWQALVHGVEDGPKGWRLRGFLDLAVLLGPAAAIDVGVLEARLGSGEAWDRERDHPVGASRLRARWEAAQVVAGYGPDSGGAAVAALLRTLAWRSRVGPGIPRAVRERLLEEGTRVEAGLPVTPGVPGTGPLRRLRRRGSSLLARSGYLLWRLLEASNKVGRG